MEWLTASTILIFNLAIVLSLNKEQFMQQYKSKVAPFTEEDIRSDETVTYHQTLCLKPDGHVSKSTVENVYFWPHRIIELPCYCENSVERCKRNMIWRYLPLETIKHNDNKWKEAKYYKNLKDVLPEFLENFFSQSTFTTGSRAPPEFYQQDGMLVITHAGLEVQGFYNCYNKDNSTENINKVHLLIGIYPLVNAPCSSLFAGMDNRSIVHELKNNYRESKICGEHQAPSVDGCSEHLKDKASKCQPTFAFPFDSWQHAYIPLKTRPKYLKNENLVTNRVVRHLYVNVKWSTWTTCAKCANAKDMRSRTGHCYFENKSPDQNIEIQNSLGQLGEKYHLKINGKQFQHTSFLNNITTILEKVIKSPLFKDGIPMHNGVLIQFLRDSNPNSYYDILTTYFFMTTKMLQDGDDAVACYDKRNDLANCSNIYAGANYMDLKDCSECTEG